MLLEQIGAMNPATFFVWAPGLFFLFSRNGRRYRALGWVFVTLLVVFALAGKSRPDRIAGGYPLVFAAGGVALEAWSRRRYLAWLVPAAAALMLAVAAFVAPVVLPFPPSVILQHPLAAGMNDSRKEVGATALPLPFSHRLGSEEFVAAVAEVFDALPANERREAVILSGDFAHAGAIEHYGPRYGLPPVYSPHNNYYLWGPDPAANPGTVIAIGLDEALLRRSYDTLELAAVYDCPLCMGWRTNLPLYVARRPHQRLGELWPRMRRYGLPTRKLLMLEAAQDPASRGH